MNFVDWSTVEDGLGDGSAVPGLVAALASSKKAVRLDAYFALAEERLVHQGTVSPAAPFAVPLLIEALRAPKHAGRALVIDLLGVIASGEPVAYLRGAVGPEAHAALSSRAGVDGDALRAVRLHADVIEARLDDKSAEVRKHTAVVLALVEPERAAVRLVERLGSEPDAEVRVTAWLGIGLALHLGATSTKVMLPHPGEVGELERAAIEIARALAGGTADERLILAALDAPLADSEIPFGRLGDAAIGALFAMGDLGCRTLSRALPAVAPARRAQIAAALVRAAFPRAHQHACEVALVPSSSLTVNARATIQILASVAPEPLWPPLAYLPSMGVTRWLPDLKRFIGLDPPGPLERRVPWRSTEVEAIVVLDAIARGETEADEGRALLAQGVSDADRVDLALASAADAYLTLHARPGWTAERAVGFAASLLPDSGATAKALERARAGAVRGYATWVALAAFAREPPDSDTGLESLFAQALPMMRGESLVAIYRGALLAVSPSLREAVVRTAPLPDQIERAPRIRNVPVPQTLGGWSFVDLAVDRSLAAMRVASAIATWPPVEVEGVIRPIEAAQRVLAALRPESKAAIEAALPTATAFGRQILEPLLRPS